MFGLATIWPASHNAYISLGCHMDLHGPSNALRSSQVSKICRGIGQAARLPVYETTKYLLYTHEVGWPLQRSMQCACICVSECVSPSNALRSSQVFKICQGVGQTTHLPIYQMTKNLLYTHEVGQPLRRSMGCACICVSEHVGRADHWPMYEIRKNLAIS